MSQTQTQLSKDDHSFLARVADTMRADGVTADKFNAELAQEYMIKVLKRDIKLSEILMDKSEGTRKFREDFARRVYDACRAG